jgi:hypothetical protein
MIVKKRSSGMINGLKSMRKREMTQEELYEYLDNLPEPKTSEFTPSEIKKINKYLDAVEDDNEVDFRNSLSYIKKYTMYLRNHKAPRRKTTGKINSLKFVGMEVIYSEDRTNFSNRYNFIINGTPAYVVQSVKSIVNREPHIFIYINGVADMYANEEKLFRKYPEFRDYIEIVVRNRKIKQTTKKRSTRPTMTFNTLQEAKRAHYNLTMGHKYKPMDIRKKGDKWEVW